MSKVLTYDNPPNLCQSRRITLLLSHMFMFFKALKLLHMAMLPTQSLVKACVRGVLMPP